MPLQSALDHWQALERSQSDWAFRAYARLIKTLSPEVQEKLLHKDDAVEPYVVIFGKTQVGKTTLLLDLMGVDAASMPMVSQVLRGGRETGKSATATAMEYCRSADDRWGLTVQSATQWFDTGDAITMQLGALREDMEAGRLAVASPCIVHLPRQVFARQDGSALQVRILDLPGDNPANRQEQDHVNHMAKTYLPFADLILLVGKGDDLGFLRPEALTLPGIQDWQTMPHRFRIVTTYSYTAQSVRDTLRKEPEFGIEKIRQRLIAEIGKFGVLSTAAKAEELYFPLEFGSSWKDVKSREPALHTRIAPVIAKLRADLLDQMKQSTSPMGRLSSTLNTHLSVKYIQQKKTEAIELKIAQLDAKAGVLATEICNWSKLLKCSQEEAESLQRLLAPETLQACKSLVRQQASNPQFSLVDPYPPMEESKTDDAAILRRLISKHERSLKGMHLAAKFPERDRFWRMARERFSPPPTEAVQKILDAEMSSIRAKLAGYTFDTYLSSSNYQADLSAVLDSSLKAKERILRLQVEQWLAALGNAEAELQLAGQQAAHECAHYQDELCQVRKQKRSLALQIGEQRADFERTVSRSQEDLERCDRFVHLLDEEYLAALDTQMHDALQAEDDCEALLQLLACEEMRQQRNDLMNMTIKKAKQEK